MNQNKFSTWTANVVDKYKGLSIEDIKKDLCTNKAKAAILVTHVEGDFNLGTCMRSANGFGIQDFYYYGKRHIDKRSAVGTWNYMNVSYLSSIDEIKSLKSKYKFVAIENNINFPIQKLSNFQWEENSLIIVGEESVGIPNEILELCDSFVEIPMYGSVRSFNLGSAASIAMYDYTTKVNK